MEEEKYEDVRGSSKGSSLFFTSVSLQERLESFELLKFSSIVLSEFQVAPKEKYLKNYQTIFKLFIFTETSSQKMQFTYSFSH